MSTTDEAVTFPADGHRHGFPCNPPGGSLLNPGPCACGKTYAQDEAGRAYTAAIALVADAYPLPDAEFLTGVQDGWHAVRRADAEWTAQHLGRDQTQAVCGKPVRLALNWPEYDGAKRPVSFDRCPECAWTVAGIRGQLAGEVERLMPSNEDRVILDGLMPDWMIAATAAAMLVEAVTEGHDDAVVEDEPEWIQLLAAISRHAPVILHREECNDGDCEHDGNCPASVACAACSLQAGSWAGEWEGTFRHECTIPAPCAVLTRLAEHAVEALAEAKRGAAEAEAWLRKEAGQ